MIPGKKFDPATETSRRPTPEKFVHLRKWIAADEKYIDITNITELKNINLQLEQSSKLYVSNVINRVIAQLLGATADGFVTLEGTDDGELKVKLTAADIASLIAIELAAGTNLIGKVEIAGISHTVINAVINFNTAATHEVIAAVMAKKIKITNLMLTVAGETNLTFQSNANPLSGDMDFGGTGEPRGMVHSFGDYPLETVAGEAFKIKSSGAVQVSGYITYYTEL